MPYFQHNDPPENHTRKFAAPPEEEWEEEPLWDDGFDELMEEEEEAEEPEIPEEELREARRNRFRLAANLGDLGDTLVGVGVILALVGFLISMLRFLSTDIFQNFSLWQTRL